VFRANVSDAADWVGVAVNTNLLRTTLLRSAALSTADSVRISPLTLTSNDQHLLSVALTISNENEIDTTAGNLALSVAFALAPGEAAFQHLQLLGVIVDTRHGLQATQTASLITSDAVVAPESSSNSINYQFYIIVGVCVLVVVVTIVTLILVCRSEYCARARETAGKVVEEITDQTKLMTGTNP
jgi:hypothetical protein